MPKLLNRLRRVQLYMESGKCRIVDLRIAAEEEHRFFVVGLFQRLADTHGGSRDGGDFYHVNPAPRLAVGVIDQGMQGSLSGLAALRFAPLDATDTAGREQMFAGDDGVEDQIDVPMLVGRDIHSEALDHEIPLMPLTVCEGPRTAAALYRSAQ